MLPYTDFKKAKVLPNGAPLRVYGVLGDGFLQKRVIDALLEWILPPEARDFNLDTLDGENATLTDVWACCGNLPFLADVRVVLVQRAERLENLYRLDERPTRKKTAAKTPKKASTKSKASPTGQDKLLQGLQNLPPTTVLILSRSAETPEVGSRIEKESCIAEVVDEAINSSEIPSLFINCLLTGKNKNRAVPILQNEAERLHIPLESDAAGYLVERAGLDIWQLLNELQKCASRIGEGEIVTTNIIEEMVRPALQDTIFSFADALGSRQTAHAIGILRELLASGEAPIVLLSRIATHFRYLLQARAILDAGIAIQPGMGYRLAPELAEQLPDRPFYEKPSDGYDNFVKLCDGSAWRGRRLAEQAQNFTTEQIQGGLQYALSADLAMKGIEGDGGGAAEEVHAMLLELTVLNFGQ